MKRHRDRDRRGVSTRGEGRRGAESREKQVTESTSAPGVSDGGEVVGSRGIDRERERVGLVK